MSEKRGAVPRVHKAVAERNAQSISDEIAARLAAIAEAKGGARKTVKTEGGKELTREDLLAALAFRTLVDKPLEFRFCAGSACLRLVRLRTTRGGQQRFCMACARQSLRQAQRRSREKRDKAVRAAENRKWADSNRARKREIGRRYRAKKAERNLMVKTCALCGVALPKRKVRFCDVCSLVRCRQKVRDYRSKFTKDQLLTQARKYDAKRRAAKKAKGE